MINSITLNSFKSFLYRELTLDNLTVLTGLNSSGKSSIIQSILILERSPRKPNKELTATIKSEVPTAFFMGSFANRTSVGIIKKPPPAPTIPEKTPITVPSSAING